MPTARDLVTDALREIGVLNSVDPASGEDAELGLRQLNRILSNWQAQGYATAAEPFDLSGELSLPNGYEAALMFTLAEDLAASFHVPIPPKTSTNAQQARAQILHTDPPRIVTQDTGMPGGGHRHPWNYLTGGFR